MVYGIEVSRVLDLLDIHASIVTVNQMIVSHFSMPCGRKRREPLDTYAQLFVKATRSLMPVFSAAATTLSKCVTSMTEVPSGENFWNVVASSPVPY